MVRNLKRISDTLRLTQESRERIRSQLSSCPTDQKGVPMRKRSRKKIIPLVAAIIAALSLTLAAAAVIAPQYQNDRIVNSRDDIPAPDHTDPNNPTGVTVTSPGGAPPFTLEEMIKSARFKSNGWFSEETINGGIAYGYTKWDTVEILESGPDLRSRQVSRADGAMKMEYTAENPAALVDTLTGRVGFNLSWMGERYDYVPDANFSYVVTDKKGNYVSEILQALYAKKDKNGYVRVTVSYCAQEQELASSYVIDGSYETAYYYTTSGGYEFVITMHNGNVWVSCLTRHTDIHLYGAYLTKEEIEDILENLSLSIPD